MSHSLSLRWSFGNSKLEKTDTVSFNLPAFRAADGSTVCPGADRCASPCYARQGRIMFPAAQAAREHNLAIIRTSLPLFERFAIDDLGRIRQTSIRVHDSGDFLSQDYLESWCRIMQRFGHKRFYAYTKSLHLDWSAQPLNFNRVQSYGGKYDHLIDPTKPHARIFATKADRKRAGYADGNTTDRPAQNGTIKIGLVYHGSTKLTEQRVIWLRKAFA